MSPPELKGHSMTPLSPKQAYTIASVAGAILWLGTAALSGRREAWDSSLYWTVAYPLAIAVAGTLGYLVPERPWRWALAVMLTQALALAIAASSFGLFPLGLIMFGVLALPAMGVASWAAAVRHRHISQ